MHSNFITPPDYIETVLIVNATDELMASLGEFLKTVGRPYNIYFYNESMNNRDWLDLIKTKADAVIDAEINNPVEYFNK